MKILLSCFSIFLFSTAFAGWIDLNTSINDELTGVTIWGADGAVSGHNGIYYSNQANTVGGTWTRFNINNNSSDSILYNNTRFNHCLSGTTNSTYFCGKDTVNNQAVLMMINLQTLAHTIVYTGSPGAGLNKIFYVGGTNYYAVGDNGLVVNFGTTTATVIPVGLGAYNLTSFGMSGNNYWYGCNGSQIKGSGTLSTMNYSIIPTSHNYEDVVYTSSSVAFAVGNGYFRSNSSSTQQLNNYNYGPLNANSLFLLGSSLFVGTDHGIFKGPISSPYYLEQQPTSSTEFINEFWKDPTGDLYACGKNGVVLQSNDQGGTPQPYVSLTSNGGCVNTSITVSEISGSSSSCAWYINGVYQNSSCGNLSHTFSTPGAYEIKLTGYNAGLVDSSVININIVNPPAFDLLTSVMDTILCHSEPIEITINNTENDVDYSLYKFGQPLTIYSPQAPGNGGSITFNSYSLNNPGPYYIKAESSLASCSRNFTDSIKLIVEYTEANVHVGSVNSALGEDVYFYEHCVDAQNYEWNFSSNANILTSNLPDVINQYNSTGNTDLELVCWSNEGCYDTTQISGPFLYQQAANVDSCWTNYTIGDPYGAAGTNIGAISEVSLANGGFLVAGYTSNEQLTSQQGSDVFLAPEGSYLAKYDDHGTLKWYAHAIFGQAWNTSIELIKSVVEDSNGDIYICGSTADYGVFKDNSGDELNTHNKSFIIKLDSRGKIIWTRTASEYYFRPYNISLDNQNNLLVTAHLFSLNQPTEFNGLPSDNLAQLPTGTDVAIIKFAPNGQFIWEAGIDGGYVTEVKSDIDGNVYAVGEYTTNCYVISSNSSVLHQVSQSGFNGYGSKMYYTKLNSNGQFVWGTYSTSVGPSQPSTRPWGMVMDSLGNAYITGQNEAYWQGYHQIFENTNGTFMTLYAGNYFIAKVDSSGMWQWGNGANSSYYGYGFEVALNEAQNEIITSGSLRNNDQVPVTTFSFTSQSNLNVSVPLSKSDVFIAKYDTSGDLKKVCTNGENPIFILHESLAGLYYQNDSTFFIARNIQSSNGNTTYSNFNDSIPLDSQQVEDYISKFRLDCATCYCPASPTIISDILICHGADYTFPDGLTMNNITAPVTYSSNFTTTEGCDSTIQTNIDFYPNESSYQENICSGDSLTFPDGNVITNIGQDLIYESIITSSNGCDSTITTYVSVYNLNATAIEDGSLGLVATTSGTYQWLDCDNNYSIITGATNQIFLPATSGSYAVQVSASVCVDTSACLVYNSNGLETLSPGNSFTFYPNPAADKLTIQCKSLVEDYSLNIYNTVGELVLRVEGIQTEIYTVDLKLPAGSYLLEFSSHDEKSHGQLIIGM